MQSSFCRVEAISYSWPTSEESLPDFLTASFLMNPQPGSATLSDSISTSFPSFEAHGWPVNYGAVRLPKGNAWELEPWNYSALKKKCLFGNDTDLLLKES